MVFPAVKPQRTAYRQPLLVLLSWLLLLAYPASSADGVASRYQRTIQSLQVSTPELRARFAAIALLELEEIYLAEADLARREAEDEDHPAKLQAWSRAVEQYAGQLVLVQSDIDSGFPVELRTNPLEVASITVAGRTLMLAHPRNGQQLAYEQGVLAKFCGGNTCIELTRDEEPLQSIPVSASTVTPQWDFSPAGPVCRYRQLQVEFSNRGSLTRQRGLCEQLMQELESMATELAWQQRHGVDVDWGQLDLRSTPGRPEHLVVLNQAGDSLLITLPLLYGTPGLLGQVSPWLQQRHSAQGPSKLSLRAASMGWE